MSFSIKEGMRHLEVRRGCQASCAPHGVRLLAPTGPPPGPGKAGCHTEKDVRSVQGDPQQKATTAFEMQRLPVARS